MFLKQPVVKDHLKEISDLSWIDTSGKHKEIRPRETVALSYCNANPWVSPQFLHPAGKRVCRLSLAHADKHGITRLLWCPMHFPQNDDIQSCFSLSTPCCSLSLDPPTVTLLLAFICSLDFIFHYEQPLTYPPHFTVPGFSIRISPPFHLSYLPYYPHCWPLTCLP